MGVRAALVWNDSTAKLARQHNDANVIAIGARQHTEAEALAFIDAFVAEPFSHDERHARRIGQVARYDETKELPPLPESALRGAVQDGDA